MACTPASELPPGCNRRVPAQALQCLGVGRGGFRFGRMRGKYHKNSSDTGTRDSTHEPMRYNK